jgi:two-component system, OmpR family, alkaline phosphatase synthesis response regulator PhoP
MSTLIEGGKLRTPAKVLLVMDQPVLAEVARLALNHGVFTVDVAPTVAEAASIYARWRPHLVILDIDLDDGAFLRDISDAAHRADAVPVIALTRRGDLKRKLQAFDAGVDDILAVPFSPEELVARTLAVMRRSYRQSITFTPTITLGELKIDILNRQVRAGTSELHLTGLEQSLLYLLAANAGRVLSRDDILDALWGVDYIADSNVVDRHVRNLRAKLQNDWRRPRYIATIPGRGYRFLPSEPAAE